MSENTPSSHRPPHSVQDMRPSVAQRVVVGMFILIGASLAAAYVLSCFFPC